MNATAPCLALFGGDPAPSPWASRDPLAGRVDEGLPSCCGLITGAKNSSVNGGGRVGGVVVVVGVVVGGEELVVDHVLGCACSMGVSGDERGKLDAIGRRVIPGELGVGPLTCAFAVILRVPVLELELRAEGVVLEPSGDVGDDDGVNWR